MTLFGTTVGLYIKYRVYFASRYALFHWLPIVIFLVGGSSMIAAIASPAAGYADREWSAFFLGALGVLPSLVIGMWLEARLLGWWQGDGRQGWKPKIDPFVDYATRQVSPLLAESVNGRFREYPSSAFGWIVSLGLNIPLFSELFGGGRQNVVFYALPVVIGCASYINIAVIGPALMRIVFLRKLEKEQGYRFANADYERIQELRRHFRFACWLMKDYRPPQPLPEPGPAADPFTPRGSSRTALKRIAAQHDKKRLRK